MDYLEYGNKNDRTVMLVHGLCATALSCYEPIISSLVDAGYHVILAEVDGHIPGDQGDFESLASCCDDVETYVRRELAGQLWCLSGFSMGATFAVELAGRGSLRIGRLLLDAAITTKLGPLSPLFTSLFCYGTKRLQEGKRVPALLLASCFGRGNDSVVEMLYEATSQMTVRNACHDLFHYDVPEGLRSYHGPVAFWRGSQEVFPAKSARQLRTYLPQLQERVFEGMGHGQQLHEHPAEYARDLLAFLASTDGDRC